jgi:transglutaminase-like putative cysteine protease
MLIRIGYDIGFDVPAPTPILLMLYVHPSREKDLQEPETLKLDPPIPIEIFHDGFGNKAARILAPTGQLRITHDTVIRDTGLPDEQGFDAVQHPVEQLPTSVLPFLLASRYCEVDRLTDIAWDLFGQTPLGWERVQAVLSWVHHHVTFGYQYARSTKTALDVSTKPAASAGISCTSASPCCVR